MTGPRWRARSSRWHKRPRHTAAVRRRLRMPAGNRDIAYLLQGFPKYSETFIVNELVEPQRAGGAVRVLSLRLPREGRFHGCVAALEQAPEYAPETMWD